MMQFYGALGEIPQYQQLVNSLDAVHVKKLEANEQEV